MNCKNDVEIMTKAAKTRGAIEIHAPDRLTPKEMVKEASLQPPVFTNLEEMHPKAPSLIRGHEVPEEFLFS
jgi:hypothetical protein